MEQRACGLVERDRDRQTEERREEWSLSQRVRVSPSWSLSIPVHADKLLLQGPTIDLQFKVLNYHPRNHLCYLSRLDLLDGSWVARKTFLLLPG